MPSLHSHSSLSSLLRSCACRALLLALAAQSACTYGQTQTPDSGMTQQQQAAQPPTAETTTPENAASNTPSETAGTGSSPVAEPPLTRNERENQLLAKAAPDEVQWLDTPNGKKLALFKPTENRMTKGALLLLHAANTPADWPATLENLRRNLPQYGWATLAVTLPPPDRQTIPPRPAANDASASSDAGSDAGSDAASSATESAPESSSESAASDAQTAPQDAESASSSSLAPTPPREEIVAATVTAAIAYLGQNDLSSVILLADNSSVYDSVQALLPAAAVIDKESTIQALVLVNLQPQETLSKDQLASIFTPPELPVMDVFFNPDDMQQRTLRQRHRGQAMRNKLRVYRQFVLPPLQIPTVNDAQSFWLERVRGFMEDQREATPEDSEQDN